MVTPTCSASLVRRAGLACWLVLAAAAPSLLAQEVVFDSMAGCNDCGPGYGPGYSAYSYGPGGTLYWDDGCQSLGNCNYQPYLPLRARCRIDVNEYCTAPAWYFTAEAVPLYRDANEDIRLTSGAPAIARASLSTNQLDLEYQAGARLLIGRALSSRWRAEFSYLGSYAWADNSQFIGITSTTVVTEMPDPMDPMNTIEEVTITQSDETLRLSFESTFNNSELNFRHRLILPPARYEASMIYGVRYMQINEAAAFSSVYSTEESIDGAPSALVAMGNASQAAVTNNDIIGFQLGLAGQFLAREDDRVWVDAEVKGAIAHNTAAMASQYENTIATKEQDATSFIGDVSVVVNYRVLRWLTFRAGYQATFVTGLALADRNIVNDPSLLSVADIDHSGNLILHGAIAGLNGAW